MGFTSSRRQRNSLPRRTQLTTITTTAPTSFSTAQGPAGIVFGGDSHDATWDHILEHHRADVTDIDLLIAPHHGRKSGRSYEFSIR